jgi:glycosyltransferase involved in cell wall biosynthesis
MKIAFITPEYVTSHHVDGGLANYIKKTAADLAGRGCEPWVFVSSRRDITWKDGLVTICEVPSTNGVLDFLEKLPAMGFITPAFRKLSNANALALRFWGEHARKPFDIIQISSYGSCGYSLIENGEVPVVCRISSYTPHVRKAYGKGRSPYEYLTDRFEVQQVLRADARFAPSQLLVKTFRQFFGCDSVLIRTTIDTHIPELDYSYFSEKRPRGRYLLFFGTLSRIKGCDLLAEVLPPLLGKYPDLYCVLIGRDDGLPGGKKVSTHILSHCEPCRERIHFHPALPKPSLYPYLKNAEAVLVPSRVDNYPNVCLEAQYFGKPVIGTFGSSLEEMLEDGKTGFLAKNGDSGSLLLAVERFLEMDEGERLAMRRNILNKIEEVRREDPISQLLQFYKAIIMNQ